MAREISISFALTAALTGGFKGAFASAASSAKSVTSALREMEKSPTGKIGAAMVTQREKIKGLASELKDARTTLARLEGQARITGGTALLTRQIAQAQQKVNSLTGSLGRQVNAWRNTQAEAATTGGSLQRLTQDYEKLAAKMERARGISKALGANRAAADALRQQRADLQGRLVSTAATAATVALPVKLAISAEDTFADLRKVMDAPEDVMLQVFSDAQEMSNRTGKSFEDVINIMTSAAQAGLGKTREELLGVADQAVKMSIAWGVSVDQAGKSMAKWRSSMNMTDEQAKHTADVINALSNEMAAEAGEIDRIFSRMGAMMTGSGMASQDVAALATAFKAAGAEVEVSGTAMKNFMKAMSAGSAGLDDKKKGIYKFLKIDPDQLQKELYTDSKAAILRVLDALQGVNPEERTSVASMLFGEESIAAISPLIKNIGLLKKAFSIANSNVSGSVDDEYANRMKTTATSINQMTQSVRNLGINAGKALLPAVGFVAHGIANVASIINGLVERFPRLSSAVMITAAAFASLAVGTLFFGLVLNSAKTGVNSIRGLFLRMAASQAAATATTAAFGAASTAAGAGARFFAGGLRSILLASGVGAVLVALGYGVSLLIDNWDSVVAAMSSAWSWVTDTWGRLGVFFTELGNNLAAIFPGLAQEITGAFASARDNVLACWNEVKGFFAGLWENMAGGAEALWQKLVGFASWAYGGVTGIWSEVTGFFSGLATSIYGVFGELFSWLREKFSWVFSAIDAVSGAVRSITGAVGSAWDKASGAVGDAWNKAFGDREASAQSAAPIAKASKEKPAAPIAQTAPAAPTAAPAASGQGQSYTRFREQEEAAKGSGGKKRGGKRAARATGPVTVVTLGGDNSKPITTFIPASSSSNAALATDSSLKSALASSGQQMALPRTPGLVSKSMQKKGAASAGSAQASGPISFTQNFDVMSSDPAAFKKVMETLKPDFEALVKRALDKISSDRRRTAYAQ